MAFNLGNFAIKEVIYGVAETLESGGEHTLLYTLDQLSSAEIAVESDSTDITDKNGSIIRRIYNSKTATVTATSAMISPVLLNAQSGSDTEVASATTAIDMPKIATVAAGGTLDISDIATDSEILVMGIYSNGANGDKLTQGTAASLANKTFKKATEESVVTLTMPPATETSGETTITGAPMYIVKYTRSAQAGIKLTNKADVFADTISLTFYVAIVDPCEDKYRAAYIYIPSFTPDPSVTITMSSDSQEMDYTGNINVSFCDACAGKVLYYIYFPDEDAVTSVTCDETAE